MALIRSRDNPKVQRWRLLARDARERRAQGRAIIEGPHLVDTWVRHRGAPVCIMASDAARAGATVMLSEEAMAAISDVRTPQGIAAEIAIPRHDAPLSDAPACVFLDAVQDAGNVGAILRSACALGTLDIVLGPGCADPWSPKVLRAAAGAHALLRIREAGDLGTAVEAFGGPVYWTSPKGGKPLAELDLRGRAGWIFGSEGQGVSKSLAGRAGAAVSIPMPGETESLNVAAAAAICLYEQSRQRASRPAARS
jgi:TrmH family RNA methyltransferase